MSLNCNITNEQEAEAIIQLLPRGKAWDSSSNKESNIYNFFLSIASSIVDYKKQVCGLVDEFFCSTQSALRNEWLAEYNLPNSCDPSGESLCLLANGLDDTLNFDDILVDAIARIGIVASVINEADNNIPLTISIIIDEDSYALGQCFYYAGNPFNACGFVAAHPTIVCDNALIASKPVASLISDLRCIFDDLVPNGIKVDYYLGDKNTPILEV